MGLLKICKICNKKFECKKFGHNAICCSDFCKSRNRYNYNKEYVKLLSSEERRNQRKRSYVAIKNNPTRYAEHLVTSGNSAKTIRAWLAEYKTSRGCIDCGYNQHSAALQLDHMGPKTASISELRTSKERILKEITDGNCVVRCAVCHAVKTWAEKNKVPYEPSMARR